MNVIVILQVEKKDVIKSVRNKALNVSRVNKINGTEGGEAVSNREYCWEMAIDRKEQEIANSV